MKRRPVPAGFMLRGWRTSAPSIRCSPASSRSSAPPEALRLPVPRKRPAEELAQAFVVRRVELAEPRAQIRVHRLLVPHLLLQFLDRRLQLLEL